MSEAKTNPCVGGFVWIFDINVRKYRRDENGRSFGGPIWREHWVRHEITGETSRSWITNRNKKIPKSGGRGIAFCEEDIDRAAFVEENRYRIGQAVGAIRDYDLLKKVADLIGYKEVR